MQDVQDPFRDAKIAAFVERMIDRRGLLGHELLISKLFYGEPNSAWSVSSPLAGTFSKTFG